MPDGSRYVFPPTLLLRIALSVALGRPRSLGDDSAAGLRGAYPPPRTCGIEHLPRSGPFVVVGNHYQRPGLWAGWGAMLANAAVRQTGERPRELHWLMTSELLAFRLGPVPVPRALLRWVFRRFAYRVYGFGLVPARESGQVGSTAGLRIAARWLAAGEPVGVLPEGTASVELCEARPGVGLFLAWLTRDEVPLIPVGVAEVEGVLTARFGPPFRRPRLAGGSKVERDAALRETVMVAIARLLPPALWGYYRPAVERAGAAEQPGTILE